MTIKQHLLIFLVSCTVLSCTTEEPLPQGAYSTGIFIVNEGNFSESNGSIGFYNDDTKAVDNDIFKTANGIAPGGILQSLYFHENLAFIIDQLGNVIHVVDANSFKSIATIDAGLSTPRYMTIANGKGYVSNWGRFDENFNLNNSYVAVIDLTAFEIVKTIPTGSGAEALLSVGSSVFVANSFSNTIEEIDITTDEITGIITVADGPLAVVQDKDAKVWVLSSSFFAGAALTQLDVTNGRIQKTFTVSSGAKSLAVNAAGDELYYLSAPYGADAQVKKLGIDASLDATTALITGPNLYGLGVDPSSGILFVANNNAFQGNGTIIRYNQSELIDSFSAGVGPNGFVFRK